MFTIREARLRRIAICCVVFAQLSSIQNYAQQPAIPPDKALTLDQAVDFALANFPAIRASFARAAASGEGISLSRTTYLPHADLIWQSNRATRNNIFGLVLPQSVVPQISGPVLSSTSDRGVWGSAAGLLLSWEPFDFGYRGATVGVATAAQNRATAELSLTKLDVAAAVGDAFLDLVAMQQEVKAAQADVDRRQVLANSVHTLVKEELRPGADSSRADAELAPAKIRLIRAQELERESQATFAQLLGIAGSKIDIDAGSLLGKPPTPFAFQASIALHPTIAGQSSQPISVTRGTTRLEHFTCSTARCAAIGTELQQ